MSSETVALAPATAVPVSRRADAFRMLWSASASATLADGIYQVALPLAALSLHGGATGVAAVYTATRAPWALCALHAGALADRYDRRRLLLLANVARAVILVVGAAVVTLGVGGIAALTVAALALGVAETVGDTAMHSITPRVVAPDRLAHANSRMQSTELITNLLVGPSLGGVLAGLALGAAFGSVAVLYAAGALAAARLVRTPLGGRPEVAGRADTRIRDAMRFLFARRTLATYAIGVGLVNAGYAAFQTALPLVVLRPAPAGLTAGGFGLLLGGAGVCGMATALCAPRLVAMIGDRAVLVVAHVGVGLGLALSGLSSSLVVVAAGVALTGVIVLGSIVTVSYRQRTVPDAMLGRVTAAYRMFAFGGLPIGSALAGVGAHVVGPATVLVLAGVCVLGAGLLMAAVTPRSKSVLGGSS